LGETRGALGGSLVTGLLEHGGHCDGFWGVDMLVLRGM
jgi:hypothetical protein